ncbi:MAG: hypothetical protein WAM82_05035, partial [Thermoanaerobaculia bacterium]
MTDPEAVHQSPISPVSLPASSFGLPAGRPEATEPLGDLGGLGDLAELPRSGRLDVLCLRPIHHVLEYEALFRFTAALRARAPAVDLHLHLRSALRDDSPFALLP